MKMGWQKEKSGIVSGSDVGGDVQVGTAYAARFVNPDLPRCVVEITVFPSAPERPIETQEGSVTTFHGFKNDLDSLGLDTQIAYVIANEGADMDSPWDDAEWERTDFDSLDTAPFGEDVKKAESAGRRWLENFDPAHITWNGEPF